MLARWASWGAIPDVFDETCQAWAAQREEVRQLLGEEGWLAAARTTINAHYTSAEVSELLWDAVTQLGFAGGRVLEPGCGSGNLLGLAPAGLRLEATGVELDPTTAAIAQLLYPSARILSEGFERSRFPADHFDLVIGDVPFGRIVLHDPAGNPGGHTMHNHFIVKSLRLTRPGGLVAVLTSRYTRRPSTSTSRATRTASSASCGSSMASTRRRTSPCGPPADRCAMTSTPRSAPSPRRAAPGA